MSSNQELLEFTIILFILKTLTFDSGVILLGEIRYLSLLGINGLVEQDKDMNNKKHGQNKEEQYLSILTKKGLVNDCRNNLISVLHDTLLPNLVIELRL